MRNRKKRILSLLCSFMLLLSMAFPAIAAETPEKISGSTAVILSDVPLADSEELLNGYVSQLLEPPGAKISLLGSWGEEGEALNEDEKIIYQSLKNQVAETAANGGSTEFLISDFRFTWTLDGYPKPSEIQEQGKALFEQKVDLRKILEYLMINCPYELYWFDKTQGFRYTSSIRKYSQTAQFSSLRITLPVAQTYQDGSSTQVNASKAQTAAAAVARAQDIVAKYAGKSDYEKLTGYKEEICALTSYDHAAAGGGKPYGDPWQIINVFDGDPDTNVVCEGYAKAFTYLCDLSQFDDAAVYSITGKMGGAGHMWNIVRLEGNNYMADLTNCDEDTEGYPDQLFLKAPVSGNVRSGYTFKTFKSNYKYTYDAGDAGGSVPDIIGMYGAEILTLHGEDYQPPVLTLSGTVEITGSAQVGSPLAAEVTGAPEDAVLHYQWYRGDQAIPDAAGSTYTPSVDDLGQTLSVAVTADGYEGSLNSQPTDPVAEAPGPIALTVTEAQAENKVYDGSTAVAITGITLDGVQPGDDVSVDTAGLNGTISNADAGTYSTVTLPALTLTGSAADRYVLTQPDAPLPLNPEVEIMKAAAPASQPGKLTVTNGLKHTYTFDLDQLLPNLPEGQVLGDVTYTLNGVQLDENYYTDGASISGHMLSLPIQKASGSSEEKIGTVEISVSCTNYTDFSANITVWTTSKETQKPLSIQNPGSKTYGDAPFPLSVTGGSGTGAVTFESSDPSIVRVEGNMAVICQAGSVTLTATKAEDETFAAASDTLRLTIGKASITITALDQTISAGDTAPDLRFPVEHTHYTVSGLVNEDALSGTVTMNYQRDGQNIQPDTTAAGVYTIAVSGAAVPNDSYESNIIYINGTLTITPASGTGGNTGDPDDGSSGESSGGSSSGSGSSGGGSSGSSSSGGHSGSSGGGISLPISRDPETTPTPSDPTGGTSSVPGETGGTQAPNSQPKGCVSDTVGNFEIFGSYQYQFTPTNGTAPTVTLSSSSFRAVLASEVNGSYFYKIYTVGQPGTMCDVYVNGTKVSTVTTAEPYGGVWSDTTAPFHIAPGASYQFKLTADKRPSFSAGSSSFRVEYAGNEGKDWFFRVIAIGKPGDGCGFYVNGAPFATAVTHIQ